MIAAFMHPVRVTRDDQERNSANDEGERVENSRQKAAQFFEILHRARQPEQESHLAADKTKIDSSEQKHAGTQQSTQVGNFFLSLEFRMLPAQGFHQRDSLAFRHPGRLRRM